MPDQTRANEHVGKDAEAGSKGRKERSAQSGGARVGGPATAASLAALQRSAGNRAVSAMMGASVPVQRKLSVAAKDMDPDVGTKSKIMGAFGRSTFAMIQGALQSYEKASTPQQKASHLQQLSNLCAKWVNEHAGSKGAQNAKRRAFVQRLIDELPAEQVALSKSMAEDIYMSNVANAGDKGSDKFALEALNQSGKMAAETGADKEGKGLAKEKGLTDAEVAAIRIFTASDYTYINPATANSPSWMKAQKGKKELGLDPFSDKTLVEEGTLHAGVAMEGLKKLEPWPHDTYRGARYTEDEFNQTFMSGKPMTFASFASSAQHEDVALKFAHGIGIEYTIGADKDIAVLCVLQLTGGRDISKISAVKKEAEVLLLPGSSYAVISVKEIDGNSVYAKYVSSAQGMGQPIPRKWYVVSLAPVPKAPLPATPT